MKLEMTKIREGQKSKAGTSISVAVIHAILSQANPRSITRVVRDAHRKAEDEFRKLLGQESIRDDSLREANALTVLNAMQPSPTKAASGSSSSSPKTLFTHTPRHEVTIPSTESQEHGLIRVLSGLAPNTGITLSGNGHTICVTLKQGTYYCYDSSTGRFGQTNDSDDIADWVVEHFGASAQGKLEVCEWTPRFSIPAFGASSSSSSLNSSRLPSSSSTSNLSTPAVLSPGRLDASMLERFEPMPSTSNPALSSSSSVSTSTSVTSPRRKLATSKTQPFESTLPTSTPVRSSSSSSLPRGGRRQPSSSSTSTPPASITLSRTKSVTFTQVPQVLEPNSNPAQPASGLSSTSTRVIPPVGKLAASKIQPFERDPSSSSFQSADKPARAPRRALPKSKSEAILSRANSETTWIDNIHAELRAQDGDSFGVLPEYAQVLAECIGAVQAFYYDPEINRPTVKVLTLVDITALHARVQQAERALLSELKTRPVLKQWLLDTRNAVKLLLENTQAVSLRSGDNEVYTEASHTLAAMQADEVTSSDAVDGKYQVELSVDEKRRCRQHAASLRSALLTGAATLAQSLQSLIRALDDKRQNPELTEALAHNLSSYMVAPLQAICGSLSQRALHIPAEETQFVDAKLESHAKKLQALIARATTSTSLTPVETAREQGSDIEPEAIPALPPTPTKPAQVPPQERESTYGALGVPPTPTPFKIDEPIPSHPLGSPDVIHLSPERLPTHTTLVPGSLEPQSEGAAPDVPPVSSEGPGTIDVPVSPASTGTIDVPASPASPGTINVPASPGSTGASSIPSQVEDEEDYAPSLNQLFGHDDDFRGEQEVASLSGPDSALSMTAPAQSTGDTGSAMTPSHGVASSSRPSSPSSSSDTLSLTDSPPPSQFDLNHFRINVAEGRQYWSTQPTSGNSFSQFTYQADSQGSDEGTISYTYGDGIHEALLKDIPKFQGATTLRDMAAQPGNQPRGSVRQEQIKTRGGQSLTCILDGAPTPSQMQLSFALLANAGVKLRDPKTTVLASDAVLNNVIVLKASGYAPDKEIEVKALAFRQALLIGVLPIMAPQQFRQVCAWLHQRQPIAESRDMLRVFHTLLDNLQDPRKIAVNSPMRAFAETKYREILENETQARPSTTGLLSSASNPRVLPLQAKDNAVDRLITDYQQEVNSMRTILNRPAVTRMPAAIDSSATASPIVAF